MTTEEPAPPQQHPLKGMPIGRRTFFRGLIAFFALLWGALTTYPLFRFLTPSRQAMAEEVVTRVELGSVSEFPENSAKNFKFGSFPALIVRTPDGTFHAYNAICTHLGCTVQYRGDMRAIWCACHGGQYDPKTGDVIFGPPPRPLEQLNVEVEQDKIVVSVA